MNMPDIKMDYQTMLADAEAKRTILDNLIASLRAALAAGLGTLGEMPMEMSAALSGQGTGMGTSDIPKGAFLGKSVPEAVNLYLTAVRKKSTTAEIAEGIKKGGIESLSKKFEVVVNNTLYRLKDEGRLLRFDDGWGLPEWYPEGFRSRVERNHKGKGKTKKKAKKKTHQKQREAKAAPEPESNIGGKGSPAKPENLIKGYLFGRPNSEFTAKELSRNLNLKVQTVNLIASKLAYKRVIEKTVEGKFRCPSKF